VVDDSAAVRSRLVALLREASRVTRVEQARDAEEAIAMMLATRFELVVLDLHLPGRGGFAVLREARSWEAPPRFAVLTNDPTEHHRRESHALGASHFFDKSTEFEELLSLVEELASG
jgi:DNA-binding NarL/FixJ family response regulator